MYILANTALNNYQATSCAERGSTFGISKKNLAKSLLLLVLVLALVLVLVLEDAL